MNPSAAYGVYPDHIELHEVVQTLNQAGFEKQDICMMVSPLHPIATMVREAGLFNSGNSTAISARLIGWLSEFGAVVIPTIGFFIGSQTFFHAFVTMNDAPALCGRTQSLVGLGLSIGDAERLEKELRDVGALVYVDCKESARASWAVELLRQTGAKGIAALEKEAATGAAA